MNIKAFKTEFIKIVKCFFLWLVLGIIVGLICGGVGALFAKSISFVTDFRFSNRWVLFLLPFLGLLSVLIYKLLGVTDIGTNQVFEAVQSDKKLPVLLAPAIFAASVITHLCGGSAGKEGAALQLGGSISGVISKIFHLDEGKRHILTLCGMAALFSAIFGTPLGACVFALEAACVGYIYSSALFPTLISSITAFLVSTSLGIKPESFKLGNIPAFELSTLWKVVLIAVIGAVVGVIFCNTLHVSEKLFKKFIKNPYLRIFIGGIIIVLLTLILNTTDYNGSGMHIIEEVFAKGEVRYEAFLFKIIFTAITIGAGFKGGEIVPTLFIGTTLGGGIALLIGLNPALGAAIGLAVLFCSVTNCPLATMFIAIEMFGASPVLYIAVGCFTSFLLSGYTSLYSTQKFIFSKLEEKEIKE